MSVLVLVFDDGRLDYLAATVASFLENVGGDETHLLIHQDEPTAIGRTREMFPDVDILGGTKRAGFGGAIRRAWDYAAEAKFNRFEWIFHLEGDFLFNRPVNLQQLEIVLDAHPEFAQMALRRQAWNAAEIEAGGVVELNPGAYAETRDAVGWAWLSHRNHFTTNPSLYRRDLVEVGWPTGQQSEGMFTHKLLTGGLPWGVSGPEVRFGYWGSVDSGRHAVHHIGERRSGSGY